MTWPREEACNPAWQADLRVLLDLTDHASALASVWSIQADRQISACAAAKLDIQKAHSEDLGTVSKGGPVRRALSASPKQLDSSTGPLRVLVAEDNLVNQKVLQKVLQRVTPESPIFIANNGQEALQVPNSPVPEHCHTPAEASLLGDERLMSSLPAWSSHSCAW